MSKTIFITLLVMLQSPPLDETRYKWFHERQAKPERQALGNGCVHHDVEWWDFDYERDCGSGKPCAGVVHRVGLYCFDGKRMAAVTAPLRRVARKSVLPARGDNAAAGGKAGTPRSGRTKRSGVKAGGAKPKPKRSGGVASAAGGASDKAARSATKEKD
jgi:hypothetical protein